MSSMDDEDNEIIFYSGGYRHMVATSLHVSLPGQLPSRVPETSVCILEIESALPDFPFQKCAVKFKCKVQADGTGRFLQLSDVRLFYILGSATETRIFLTEDAFFGNGCRITQSGKFTLGDWSSESWYHYAHMLARLGPTPDGRWPCKPLFALYNLELQKHVRVTRIALV